MTTWDGYILYFTRTVTQMNQVIDEVKRSAYDTKATIMASRRHLCIHSPVINGNHHLSLKIACKNARKENAGELSCGKTWNFGNENSNENDKKKQKSDNQYKVLDIEDLKSLGHNCNCCPYYYTKKLATESEVVVLSYTYLTDNQSRGVIKEMIPNSYIVFDEGHNVVKCLEDSLSFTISKNEMETFKADIINTIEVQEKNSKNMEKLGIFYHLKNLFDEMIVTCSDYFKQVDQNRFFDGQIIKGIFSHENYSCSSVLQQFEEENPLFEDLKVRLREFINFYNQMLEIYSMLH